MTDPMTMIESIFGSTLNAVIALSTILIATMIYCAMGQPVTKMDDRAFESLLTDDDGEWADDMKEEAEAEAKAKALKKETIEAAKKAADAALVAPGTAKTADEKVEQLSRQQQRGMPAPPRPKKIEEGPFRIGDRVILKDLVSESGKKLNGRHGIVADVRDDKTHRYPVDLDLFDPSKKGAGTLSVKAENLQEEPSIPDDIAEQRAKVVNGCLDEPNGRAFDFIFGTMRKSVAMGMPESERKDARKVANVSWMSWQPSSPTGGNNAGGNNNAATAKGVYPSLRKYLTHDILRQASLKDIEKQVNPNNPDGAYKIVNDAVKSPLAVSSWNVRVSGDFYVVGMDDKNGTLVVPVANRRAVYCVLGIRTPLGAKCMQTFPRPPKFHLTLVPWYGRLVHDPLVTTTTGTPAQVMLATPPQTAELMENLQLAKEEGRIVARLSQLEVPGGSTEGLPYVLPVVEPPPKDQPPPIPQEPATQDELNVIDNFQQFDPMPLAKHPATGQPVPSSPIAVWNFIRKGTTSETNPNKQGLIVLANGQHLGPFTWKAEGYTPDATDILKAALNLITTKTNGKRPNVIGVDDMKCFQRLQFLFKGVAGTRIVGLNVKREAEGAAKPPGAGGPGGGGSGGGGGGAGGEPEAAE